MNRLFVLVAFLTLAVAPAANAVDIERVVSPGGIEAWLVYDPAVPVISMDVAWRGGSVTDAEGKEGLANMVSGLLDEGAGDLDSEAFQRRVQDLAIAIQFSAGYDNFGGDLKTLSANRDEAFRLFGLAITAPRFDAEPVDRVRGQILAALAREGESARRVAGLRWRALVFGDHAYARPVRGSAESVAALTDRDLRDFVAARLARDNLVVAVAGDIDAATLAPLLDRTFGALPEKSAGIAV
ncbi:MAG: insulinase family protein, partial [Alphaproteobacteria bacterium]